jgi:hypothetical protein
MKKDVNALAEAMAEWPQNVKKAGVKLDNGVAYNPRGSRNPLTLMTDDPPRLYREMLAILDGDGWDDPGTGSKGWDRIMEQAGPGYLWEWLMMDRTAPWADLFTEQHRWNVAVAVAHTLKRGV